MKYFLIAILLPLSFESVAGSGSFFFEQVGVLRDNGKIYAIVQLDRDISDAPECASSNKHQVSFEISDELGKLFYTTALTAVTAQKSIYMHYSGIECGVWGSRPLATRIDIKK